MSTDGSTVSDDSSEFQYQPEESCSSFSDAELENASFPTTSYTNIAIEQLAS
jgi:hypothetical protein